MNFSRYASRWRAPRVPGARRTSPGTAAPMAAPFGNVSPFVAIHAPMLWTALVPTFGSLADYWIDGDSTQALTITVIWKDGAADEEVSPGRYSHALVRNADLPRPPKVGDVTAKDGLMYDVVRVFAYEYKFCTIVLQESGEIPVPAQLTWDQIPGIWDEIPGTFDEAGNI